MNSAGANRANPFGPARGRAPLYDLLKVGFLAVILVGQASGPARAGFVLGFDQSNYQVDAGQEFDVSVYLTETGTNVLATDGLNSAGFVLAFNVPTMASDPAQAVKITPNPGVNAVDDLVSTKITAATATQAGAAELMFSAFLSPPLKPASGASSILLGVFHFRAGSVPGQATNLTTAISAGAAQFYSGANRALDASITTSTATITVRSNGPAPVPEPRALLLLASGLAAQAGWLSHLGRRRRGRGVGLKDVNKGYRRFGRSILSYDLIRKSVPDLFSGPGVEDHTSIESSSTRSTAINWAMPRGVSARRPR